MKRADTIIDASWVIPVDGSDHILENHSIAINANRIEQILPTSEASGIFKPNERVMLNGHALIPGFINAHTHASMSLLRGVAEDLPLKPWLENHIWPLEGRWVSPEFVRDGALLAFAESIKCGTTCLNDMYFFPEVVGEIAEKSKMRVALGMIALEFPTNWAKSANEYLEKGLALHQNFQGSELVSMMLAPHAPYTVADTTFEKLLEISHRHSLGIHMHVHETAQEVKDSMEQFGVRPIQRMKDLGLVNSSLVAVHATQLLDEEIALLAEAGSNIAHCPKSNLKLGSGICPVSQLLANKVNVAIGTDGAASNNSLNMLEEMRFATLLAKGTSGDPTNVPVNQALRMATINGAACLGLDKQTGSLEVGKLADITAIDLNHIQSKPIYDPVSQIVHSSTRNQVTDVWVGGDRVLNSGNLTVIDESECMEIANKWQHRISSND